MVENWLTATDGRRPGVARAVRLVVVLVLTAMTLVNATILVDQAAISLALSNIMKTSTSARSVAMGAERETFSRLAGLLVFPSWTVRYASSRVTRRALG